MNFRKKLFVNIVAVAFALFIAETGKALLIDFEDLPDLVNAGDSYGPQGIHFSNAISLTSGFSLNEFDFPPSSGLVAIGDDFAPIEILFDDPADGIFANFTYDSQLTFSAYDGSDALVGTYLTAGFSNLGSTELINLDFTSVSRLVIAGEWDGSYIMDDLNFESSIAPIPEPSAAFLFAAGFLVCIRSARLRS